MQQDPPLLAYVASVMARGQLQAETEKIRTMLVGLHKYPIPNREVHAHRLSELTRIFKALLLAKETQGNPVPNE